MSALSLFVEIRRMVSSILRQPNHLNGRCSIDQLGWPAKWKKQHLKSSLPLDPLDGTTNPLKKARDSRRQQTCQTQQRKPEVATITARSQALHQSCCLLICTRLRRFQSTCIPSSTYVSEMKFSQPRTIPEAMTTPCRNPIIQGRSELCQ